MFSSPLHGWVLVQWMEKKKEANMNSGLETDCPDRKEHNIDRTSQSTFTYNPSWDPYNILKLWFPAHRGLTESTYAK